MLDETYHICCGNPVKVSTTKLQGWYMDHILDGLWTIGYALSYGHWQVICVQQSRGVILRVLTGLQIPFLEAPFFAYLVPKFGLVLTLCMPCRSLPPLVRNTYGTKDDLIDGVDSGVNRLSLCPLLCHFVLTKIRALHSRCFLGNLGCAAASAELGWLVQHPRRLVILTV